MTAGPTELLVLRLGLIAVMFVFVAVVALTLRGGLSSALAGQVPSARSRTSWRLVVVTPGESGLRRGAEFPLAGNLLLGRDSRAGIVLADDSVSTRHATIERVATGWKLTDLGSTNGTLVDGQPFAPAGIVLHGNERISVGGVVLQLLSR